MDWHFLLESQAPRTLHDAFVCLSRTRACPEANTHSDFVSHYLGRCGDSAGLQICVDLCSTMTMCGGIWVFHPNGGHRSQIPCHGLHQLSCPLWCCPKIRKPGSENTSSTVHFHSAHYKVDLDVGGKTAGRGIDSGQGVEELSIFALGLMEVFQKGRCGTVLGVSCFL